MKKLLALAVTALIAATSVAQNGGSQPYDRATIEAAKKEAARSAGALSATTPNNSQAMRDSLKDFQATTGIEGVEQMSSPGSRSRNGQGKVNINQSLEFRCGVSARPVPSSFTAGVLGLSLESCQMAPNGAVASVSVSLCDEPARGGACSTAADYSKRAVLTPGAYTNINGADLGIGCNSAQVCLLTVRGSYTYGGTDEQMKQKAVQTSTQSNLTAGLRDTVEKHDIAAKMQEIGDPLQRCLEQNQQGAATGTYKTCDGSQTLQTATPADPARCKANAANAPRQCIKEAVSVQNYTQSCTRSFPLTQKVTTYSLTRKQECVVKEATADFKGTFVADSCKPDDKTNLAEGMTLVGELDWTCEQTAPDKEGNEQCVLKSRKLFFADVDNMAVKGDTQTPSRVGGACDTNPLSGTRTFQCNGEWFGRTLNALECTAEYEDEGTGQGTGITALTFLEKPGCGVCTEPQIGMTCYGTSTPTEQELNAGAEVEDGCGHIDLNLCSLTSSVPLSLTGEGGLVSAQKDTYSCRKESKQCVQWSVPESEPGCLSTDMAMGTDKIKEQNPSADGAFQAALVAAAQADATAKGIEGPQNSINPLLFGGEAAKCDRPVGGFGQLLNKNCCRTNLERPKKGNIIQNGCDMDDVELAAARRSNYAHYVGDYCSRRLPRYLGRKCIRRTEAYCKFGGILPRIIQEQGRAQLSQMVSSSVGASVQKQGLSYSYIGQGNGTWTPPINVNGVKISAYQWPSYCADPKLAAEKLLTEPDAKECPGVVTTYIAACEAAECEALPSQPMEGSLTWQIKDVDPLENVTTALSRYAVVTGACSTSTGSCQYEASAWPAGVGGKAVATKDLSWPLFGGEEVTSASAATAGQFVANNMGDFIFRTFPASGSAMPATIRVDFSRDGGNSWQTYAVPTNLKAQEYQFAGTDVKLTGFCDQATNSCEYRATGTVTVTAKSWGDARNPDCSGFTPGQISALDFSKMDLSEWLSTVVDKVGGGGTQQELTQKAQAQVTQFNARFQQGKVQSNAPTAANFSRIVPAEGFGPFQVRLVVSGYWPETTGDASRDTEKVLSVSVDWGDCSAVEALAPVPPGEGIGFRGFHTYLTPNDSKHNCLRTSAADNLERNVNHKVKMIVQTSKGQRYERMVSVENAWSTFPGASKNNDLVARDPTTVNVQNTTTYPKPNGP